MRWLPVRPPKFKEALIGGSASGILLVGLRIGLAQFLKHTDVGSFYGSALTLVLVLFWIYFAMQAFLYGAELASELARTRRAEELRLEMEMESQWEDEGGPIEPELIQEETEERKAELEEESIVATQD